MIETPEQQIADLQTLVTHLAELSFPDDISLLLRGLCARRLQELAELQVTTVTHPLSAEQRATIFDLIVSI